MAFPEVPSPRIPFPAAGSIRACAKAFVRLRHQEKANCCAGRRRPSAGAIEPHGRAASAPVRWCMITCMMPRSLRALVVHQFERVEHPRRGTPARRCLHHHFLVAGASTWRSVIDSGRAGCARPACRSAHHRSDPRPITRPRQCSGIGAAGERRQSFAARLHGRRQGFSPPGCERSLPPRTRLSPSGKRHPHSGSSRPASRSAAGAPGRSSAACTGRREC